MTVVQSNDLYSEYPCPVLFMHLVHSCKDAYVTESSMTMHEKM